MNHLIIIAATKFQNGAQQEIHKGQKNCHLRLEFLEANYQDCMYMYSSNPPQPKFFSINNNSARPQHWELTSLFFARSARGFFFVSCSPIQRRHGRWPTVYCHCQEDQNVQLFVQVIAKAAQLSYFKTMRLVPLSSFKFHKAKEIDIFFCVC